MKNSLIAALAVAGAFTTSGCATVLNGPNVDYVTETTPSGAQARFTSGQECVTPCAVDLRRKNDQRLDLYAEGYKPTYVLIQSRLGGAVFGNAIAGRGAVVGATVDGINGSSNWLYPRPLFVQLARIGTDEEAMLLDKDGNVLMSVEEHNNSVRLDVAKTIGADLAGLKGG